MQHEKEELTTIIGVYDIQEHRPKSLELYEEYSQKSIDDTIRIRKENFERADVKTKGEMAKSVQGEIEGFQGWLEETKNLESTIAYYYSVSLKSLLLGLRVGRQIAQLFDTILSAIAEK